MRGYRTAVEEIFVEDQMWQANENGRVTLAQVRDDIELVRREIDHLKARPAAVAERAATVVRSQAEWADAAAHAQLGNYPWAKLSGALAGAFLAPGS
ncbi:hypothetical protein RGCCGE502_20370 [Rhizobium grahamii CCGE 502]|nr:hypothetical protein RGCCGE502_20370 [Rhizobium grahamii CCGE 502]